MCSNKESLNVTIVEMVYLQIDENDLEMSQKWLRIIFEPEWDNIRFQKKSTIIYEWPFVAFETDHTTIGT